MLNDLKGKRILITGGTTGIGRATAILLASKGAKVVIFGRHQEELNQALNDARNGGGEVYGFTADVSKPEDFEKIFQNSDQYLGGLDILINNAALPGEGVANTPFDRIHHIIHTNLVAYLICAKEAIKRFEKEGHIVNIGSLSSKVADGDSDIYVATKSGVDGFSDSIRKQLNEKNIRVTLIRPGLVNTDLIEMSPEKREELLARKRMLHAGDIANAIYYAITQPIHAEVMQIDIKPLKQII